jgi:hypothetical protein
VRNRSFVAVAAAIGMLASSAAAASAVEATEPAALARAQAIRADVTARYRVLPGRGLAVTEATSTAVVESFALTTPDFLETRFLPADNGVWYAICPVRASCPYPAPRVARPAADLVPRRLALELALRTFLETSADVVAVGLPTTRFVVFVAGRDELAHDVDIRALAEALRGAPARALSSSLAEVVDRVTRPRVFVALGLWPGLDGGDAWVGVPRWPTG